MNQLEIRNISKAFKQRKVVDRVNMEIRQGEVIGLLGPNGAGKTTSFRIMLGMVQPDEGQIVLNGEDITALPVYVRARHGISFLPQEPSVLRGLTVADNITAIMQMRHSRNRSARLEDILTDMGLEGLQDRPAFQLSGGERRRLEIARSLVLEPRFLLLDEPFAGIDPIQIAELRELISRFRRQGIGIVITDHNVREILKITDRSYIIHHGQVIFAGDSVSLIADERVKREYLGEEFRWN